MSKEDNKELKLSDVSLANEALVNADQFNLLFKATPEAYKYNRPAKGGGTWTYVKGSYIKKVLNFVTGFNWDFEVVKEHLLIEAGQVVVLGKLTVRLNGQPVVKMQYGRADIKFKTEAVLGDDGKPIWINKNGRKFKKTVRTNIPLDIGNDFKAASTDALKKCASDLGIAQDVYAEDEFKEVKVKKAYDIEATDYEKERKRIANAIENAQTMVALQKLAKYIVDYDLTDEFSVRRNIIESNK